MHDKLDIDAGYPLTPLQAGMLYQWQVTPQSGVNVQQCVIALPEPVDAPLLRRSWKALVERHAVLRTAFRWEGLDSPRQFVAKDAQLAWQEHDLSGLPSVDQQERFEAFLRTDRRHGFNLASPPLSRLALFRFDECDFRLVWTHHHILLDGRSLPKLLAEVFDDYEARRLGIAVAAELPPPFRAFAEHVADPAQEPADSAAFWTAQLADLAAPQLPFPHATLQEDDSQTHDHEELQLRLDRAATVRLSEFAQHCGVTFHTLVQGAWGLALSAFTGSLDVAFGSTRACRKLPVEGIDDMAGMLINTVPFRVKIAPQQPLVAWLRDLRDQQIALRPHEATSLASIRKFSPLPAGTPLFRTLLMFDEQELESILRRRGGAWERRHVELREKTEFDLSAAGYLDGEFVLKLEYNPTVFARHTVEGLLSLVDLLLGVMPDMARDPLGSLPTTTPGQRTRVLRAGAGETRPTPSAVGLHGPFEKQAAATPNAIAVVDDSGELTYRELNERANRLAHLLVAEGVGQGTFVGLCLERSPDMIAAAIAILKTGAAYVPLDPAYPEDRLRIMLADTTPQAIVTRTALAERLAAQSGRMLCLDRLDDELAMQPTTNLDVGICANARAVVLYTSGSTGKPKGVVLTHGGLLNHNQSTIRKLELESGDRLPQVSTINFDASIEEIFTALNSGATLVLPTAETMGSMTQFVEMIEQRRITVLVLTTRLWHELVLHLAEESTTLPNRIRAMYAGGERATRATYNAWLRVGGDRVRWINAYGPTETSVVSLVYERDTNALAADAVEDPPIGRPIDNTFAYVLDEARRLLPPGVPGELYLGGAGVAEGYLHRPELTNDRFLADPFRSRPGAVMYKTGDRVRLREDGQFDYRDRLDQQVKLRGFRIELGEVEAALAAHPDVRDAVVKVLSTPSGAQQLVAYVAPKPERELTRAACLAHLAATLPAYMQPSAVVVLDALPKSINGKVDRAALPAPAWNDLDGHGTRREPRSELESSLLGLWKEVLRIADLGIDDEFVALGGDSLRAMSLLGKIERKLGRRVPLALLLKSGTVANVAAALEQSTADQAGNPVVLLRPGRGERPLFLVHSLGGDVLIYGDLVAALETDQAVYGLQLRGLDGCDTPHDAIEDCAADGVDLIRSIQPEGPYAIAGYSSGGVVAYEIARRLTAEGGSVELLGLIDSDVPSATAKTVLETSSPTLAERCQRFINLCRAVAHAEPGAVRRLAGRWLRRLTGLLRNRDANEHADLLQFFSDDISFFPKWRIELIRQHLRALDAFQPSAFAGDAVVFRTATESWNSLPGGFLGWDHLVQGLLTKRIIRGAHSTMMKRPHVAALAAAMNPWLVREQSVPPFNSGDARPMTEQTTASVA